MMFDERIEAIQMLILDVDGVLTDGSIRLDDLGREIKRFSCKDGLGLRLWQRLGYEVAILTGRDGQAVQHRSRELGIHHVIQGRMDKRNALHELLGSLELDASQVAMVGDDIPDLPVMRLVGYPIAVADAVPEVCEAAAYVTTQPGGQGAVREAVEHLLKAKDRWEDALALFE